VSGKGGWELRSQVQPTKAFWWTETWTQVKVTIELAVSTTGHRNVPGLIPELACW
jgi:hypothetical protein